MFITASQDKATLLVHRTHLEQQSPKAGWPEFSCKGPGSPFSCFAGLMVSAQKNIYFCFVDYAKALTVSDQIRSVAHSCLTICDPMNRSMPGLPVSHQLLEFTETHVH